MMGALIFKGGSKERGEDWREWKMDLWIPEFM
jgi:hypothetical protein